ncbi:ABC transporter permease [Actinokineospora inagensis]|uniref:ABC transporter permease n=1 Tax=Actinokineospora inagensis TaxID=103730 RepID=UPI000424F425|nr:ABC transporter permease [Actinokineospora inagensis]
MSLLTAERIKLLSTRSPWWCGLLAIVLPVGFTVLLATQVNPTNAPGFEFTPAATQGTASLGRAVVMVLAALAVTSEYRFGTIRSTFQAAPQRVAALLAKSAVVVVLTAVIGAVVGFGSWAVFRALHSGPDLDLVTAADWRSVAGEVLVFALTGALALGVGILVRQTAGAVAILLVYALLVEGLIGVIPKVGRDIQHWMPFFAADRFLGIRDGGDDLQNLPLGPWAYLAYFAAITVVVLGAGIFAAVRRDA